MEASSVTKVKLLLARGAGECERRNRRDHFDVLLTRESCRSSRRYKAGASGLNAQNEDGETLLMRAVRAGKTELARLLLAQGADGALSIRWAIRFRSGPSRKGW